jgi:hypothetical protein
MVTTANPNPTSCLLTDQGGGYYKGAPGALKLGLHDIKGSTQFNIVKSVVWDITNFPTQLAVSRTCTATTFSFTIEAGKKYHVQLECSQQPSPYEAVATLNEEGCGQKLATINVTNQMPGLVVMA